MPRFRRAQALRGNATKGIVLFRLVDIVNEEMDASSIEYRQELELLEEEKHGVLPVVHYGGR